MAAHRRRLLVMDVDSTLITGEVIEMLAARAGALEEVAAVTEAAMRGELDFAVSLAQRVAYLKGLPDDVFDDVVAEARFTDGAPELVAEAQRRGWVVGLVSGGFVEVVGPLAAQVGITRYRANRLETEDGKLTGRTAGPVIDRDAKVAALREFAEAEGVDMADTIAIGDGANDLGMIAAAAIGIAFNAKPIVQEQAPHVLPGTRLDAAVELLDALDARV